MQIAIGQIGMNDGKYLQVDFSDSCYLLCFDSTPGEISI